MHQGVTSTLQTIMSRYYIRGLYQKLANFMKSCTTCRLQKKNTKFSQTIYNSPQFESKAIQMPTYGPEGHARISITT